MEDVVKDLLIRLGHPINLIVFQRGRVDLSLHDGSVRPAVVFEVKRSIASEPERAAARRQAMDYSCSRRRSRDSNHNGRTLDPRG
jgi:hypothetical protein